MTEGGSGNDYDAGYPDQVPSEGWPLTLDLADYDTNGSAMLVADAAGEYYRVNGDIDGSYIESRGDGLYYATGNIKLDKDLDADVTLVAEGEVEVSGSTQVLDPYINGVLIFADQTYTGIDQCDKFAVKMSGSSNAWTGLIYAPKALIEMSGSSNTSVTGSLLGYSVRVNGSDVHIEASGGGSSSYGPLFSLID